MRNVRVLVANEPRAYREAFIGALHILRPTAEVVEARPEDLDKKAEEFRPDLVFSSHVSPLMDKAAFDWVLLYPEEEPSIMIFTQGGLSTVGNAELKDLVALVDRTSEAINNGEVPSP